MAHVKMQQLRKEKHISTSSLFPKPSKIMADFQAYEHLGTRSFVDNTLSPL
jgi:hypothetical protein